MDFLSGPHSLHYSIQTYDVTAFREMTMYHLHNDLLTLGGGGSESPSESIWYPSLVPKNKDIYKKYMILINWESKISSLFHTFTNIFVCLLVENLEIFDLPSHKHIVILLLNSVSMDANIYSRIFRALSSTLEKFEVQQDQAAHLHELS